MCKYYSTKNQEFTHYRKKYCRKSDVFFEQKHIRCVAKQVRWRSKNYKHQFVGNANVKMISTSPFILAIDLVFFDFVLNLICNILHTILHACKSACKKNNQ